MTRSEGSLELGLRLLRARYYRTNRKSLEVLFIHHWEQTKDLSACIDLLASAVERRLLRRRRGAKQMSRSSVVTAYTPPRLRRFRMVVWETAKLCGIGRAEVLVATSREASRCRFKAMWILRREFELSLQDIAVVMGGMDHTNVIWGVERVDGWIKSDHLLERRLRKIAAQVRSSISDGLRTRGAA